ncbi:hypothetical protein ABIA33_003525 [Streptacidiphilus sp. MAP12-16]|uniref:hypothetical protein n=1 Tax=Streptacidiphilus sp. MAP12-16 TaxID=3156300 RepID=UPI003512CACA
MTYPTSTGGEEGLLGLLCDVVGSRISSVSYLVPSGAQWPDGREGGLVHEVDHGVELALANGRRLALRWEMEGENEFLGVSSASLGDGSSGSLIDSVDVSDLPEWSSIIGLTIRGIGVAWHIANLGCPNSVWALRFDLEDGPSFVIALGEIRDDAPAYLPDAVLVLFEKEVAELYQMASSTTSAWGLDFLTA